MQHQYSRHFRVILQHFDPVFFVVEANAANATLGRINNKIQRISPSCRMAVASENASAHLPLHEHGVHFLKQLGATPLSEDGSIVGENNGGYSHQSDNVPRLYVQLIMAGIYIYVHPSMTSWYNNGYINDSQCTYWAMAGD